MTQKVIAVKSGDLFVAREGETLEVVLGSCVAFCVYDKRLKFGGATHYLLPGMGKGNTSDPLHANLGSYGDAAIGHLLRRFKELSSVKQDLQISILASATGSSAISDLNVNLARKKVQEFRLNHARLYRGDSNSLMFRFNSSTGEILVKKNLASSASAKARVPKLIVVGASTGGTEALRTLVGQLPSETPPILIVQHMPGGFTRALADGLNEISKVEVREAVEGELLQPNRVLIAPGGQQMKLAFEESRYLISIVDDPGFKGFKPSVDYLFESIASLPIAKYTSAAILTGMGSDGARGMGKLRREGAFTIAQDEETSIVFGMPKEAIELGAVVEVLPLTQISARLLERL